MHCNPRLCVRGIHRAAWTVVEQMEQRVFLSGTLYVDASDTVLADANDLLSIDIETSILA